LKVDWSSRGFVFEAHRLVSLNSVGLRIKKKKKKVD